MSTTVECRLLDNSKIPIHAHTFVGSYAVHPRVLQARPSGPGWTVTHRTTGFLVWGCQTQEEAVRAAEWLDAQKLFPDDAVAVEGWRVTVAPAKLQALIAELQAIAPKWPR